MSEGLSRKCNRCLQEKLLSAFTYNTKGKYGRFSICKHCRHEQYKETYHGRDKFKHTLKKYGLSQEAFVALHIAQSGQCAICKTPILISAKLGDTQAAVVDHCHTTGKIRGLLCHKCNRGLGSFKDDPNTLESAMKYLQKQKEESKNE